MQPYLTHAGVGVIVDVLVGVNELLGVGEAVGVGVASGVGVGVGHPGAGTHPPSAQAIGPRLAMQSAGGIISVLQATKVGIAARFTPHQQ